MEKSAVSGPKPERYQADNAAYRIDGYYVPPRNQEAVAAAFEAAKLECTSHLKAALEATEQLTVDEFLPRRSYCSTHANDVHTNELTVDEIGRIFQTIWPGPFGSLLSNEVQVRIVRAVEAVQANKKLGIVTENDSVATEKTGSSE